MATYNGLFIEVLASIRFAIGRIMVSLRLQFTWLVGQRCRQVNTHFEEGNHEDTR